MLLEVFLSFCLSDSITPISFGLLFQGGFDVSPHLFRKRLGETRACAASEIAFGCVIRSFVSSCLRYFKVQIYGLLLRTTQSSIFQRWCPASSLPCVIILKITLFKFKMAALCLCQRVRSQFSTRLPLKPHAEGQGSGTEWCDEFAPRLWN